MLALLLGAAVLAGVDFARGGVVAPDPPDVGSGEQPSVAPLSPVPTSPSASPSPSATESTQPSVPYSGSGEFDTAGGEGPIVGTGGELYRYRVQVERGIGQDVDEFADYVEKTLGDERSWIAGGNVRFQRVSSGSYEFTIYLATPTTTDQLCAPLDTNGFTSCRQGDNVVINLARWVLAVPHWDSDLETYRQYVINHEVGHRLGHQHEKCPGQGQPAPVMQQQTLQLAGCKGNAWPYIDGRLHRGPVGSY